MTNTSEKSALGYEVQEELARLEVTKFRSSVESLHKQELHWEAMIYGDGG